MINILYDIYTTIRISCTPINSKMEMCKRSLSNRVSVYFMLHVSTRSEIRYIVTQNSPKIYGVFGYDEH